MGPARGSGAQSGRLQRCRALESAGYKMLNDILDLEREDITKIPGMTPETADQLLVFVSELTDEDSGEESRPRA